MGLPQLQTALIYELPIKTLAPQKNFPLFRQPLMSIKEAESKSSRIGNGLTRRTFKAALFISTAYMISLQPKLTPAGMYRKSSIQL